MYIQRNRTKGKNGKVYTAYFLCRKYRESGKIKTEVLANLSKLPLSIIDSISNLLKNSTDTLFHLKDLIIRKSIDFGLVFLIIFLLKRLRIRETLKKTVPNISSILELIIVGKIATKGSKLAIYNWAKRNTHICKNLGVELEDLKVDDLYQALGAASFAQEKIEKKWFVYNKSKSKDIFLYDITSTYFEGTENDLAEFGYNRDRKKGKMQINIGLITDGDGFPLKISVFEGNITDQKTVVGQLNHLKNEFGAEKLTFIGDRGMKIKYNLESLSEQERAGIQYITGLEHSEIEQLIKDEVIQLSLFSKELAEIETEKGRFVLSVNPDLMQREQSYLTAQQLKTNTELSEIKESWQKRKNQNAENIVKLNNGHKNKNLVTEFSKKKLESFILRCDRLLQKNKMSKYYDIEISNNEFKISFDIEKYNKAMMLAGKYVVTTNIRQQDMTKEEVRQNYKSLSKVEHAFRDFKSNNIQIRPVYHRNEHQTRGHVLVSMFSYAIIKEMEDKIYPFLKIFNKEKKSQLSFNDILEEMKDVKLSIVEVPGTIQTIKYSELSDIQKDIFELWDISKNDFDMRL